MGDAIPTKVCSKCKVEKPLTDFSFDKRKKDGRQTACKECCCLKEKARRATPEVKASKAKSDREYYDKNKDDIKAYSKQYAQEGRSFIDGYKSVPCMDCGLTFPVCCMEFDHVRGEKLFTIGRMRVYSHDQIITEIAKCDIVCCNCHRIRTAANRKPSKDERILEYRAFMDGYKSALCTDCGLCFPPVAMDFDHVKGEKVLDVSRMCLYPRWKAIAEMDKCELVCANCHRIRTKANGGSRYGMRKNATTQ